MAGIRRKNVTAAQRAEVLKLFEQGLPAKEVARASRLSLSEVYKIRREASKAGLRERLLEQALSSSLVKLISEHREYLREQLRYLIAHVRAPEPDGVILWSLEQGLGYPLGELYLSGSHGVDMRRTACVRINLRNGGIDACPEMEEGGEWKFLWPHLETEREPAIAEDYSQWKKSLGQLFYLCHSFLTYLGAEVDRRIEEMMRGSPGWQGVRRVFRWGEPGVYVGFYEDIYRLVAGQREWDREEFRHEPARLQPDLVELWRGGRGLAIGTQTEVDVYRKVHTGMRHEGENWHQVQELREAYEECRKRAEALFFKLSVIEKRGDFQGTCEICRPWHPQ